MKIFIYSNIFILSMNLCEGKKDYNEMVSLGDTVSTYFNHHLAGGGGVLCKLRSELRKES